MFVFSNLLILKSEYKDIIAENVVCVRSLKY